MDWNTFIGMVPWIVWGIFFILFLMLLTLMLINLNLSRIADGIDKKSKEG